VNLPHPEGKLLKGVTVIEAVAQADVVITVSKLKTHALTGLTGAVKVTFGAVPSPLKTEYHMRMPKVGDFSQALLDICSLVKPSLTVMDAVVGLEGEGPSAGSPRPIEAILASADSLACDVAAAALVGFDQLAVSTTRAAVRLGLISGRLVDVELLGDPLSEVAIGSFKPASTWLATNRISEFLLALYGRVAGPKPIMNSACNGCRTCLHNCPPQAITMVNKWPVVDYGKCIRCFCCQELCPQKAVTIHHPWLGRVILRTRESR
jgi:ferredoxin